MSEDGFKLLAAELRDAPPPTLAELSDEDLRHLTAAVRDARHRQAAELKIAGDKAAAHIPRLLRGPVRKVLG